MLLVALTLRLLVIALPSFENLMDADHMHSWEQGNVARSLVAGHGFGSPFVSSQPSAIMPPVYPLIVAAVFLVFGVHTWQSILAIHVFDCVVNSLAVIPVFLLARRSFGPRVAKWAGWTWACFPYGIYFSAAWAWSTHLVLLCLCILLYIAPELDRSTRLSLWTGFGLIAGFAGLTEPSILVVVAFLLLFAAVNLARSGMKWFPPLAVASLTVAAVIAPWLIRDARVFHRFIPIRDSLGLELWMGNNGYDERWTSDQLHPLHDVTELALYNTGELHYMDQKKAEAESYIHDHPAWYLRMSARRAVYLWTGYWSFDKAYLQMEPTDPENIPFATCLTALGLLGLYAATTRQPREALRFAGVLFLFPVIYYFTHPEPYHLRPLDPVLIILGCYAIHIFRNPNLESNG